MSLKNNYCLIAALYGTYSRKYTSYTYYYSSYAYYWYGLFVSRTRVIVTHCIPVLPSELSTGPHLTGGAPVAAPLLFAPGVADLEQPQRAMLAQVPRLHRTPWDGPHKVKQCGGEWLQRLCCPWPDDDRYFQNMVNTVFSRAHGAHLWQRSLPPSRCQLMWTAHRASRLAGPAPTSKGTTRPAIEGWRCSPARSLAEWHSTSYFKYQIRNSAVWLCILCSHACRSRIDVTGIWCFRVNNSEPTPVHVLVIVYGSRNSCKGK